jgi:uncharacterized protein
MVQTGYGISVLCSSWETPDTIRTTLRSMGANDAVLISGASGLIGATLAETLRKKGQAVYTLVRRSPVDETEIRWQNELQLPETTAVSGAVVHLAGEPVMGAWTAEKKRAIHDSRVLRTKILAETLAGQTAKPRVLVCASAVGYYGNRGDEILTEASTPGTGFLAETCVAWESATVAAQAAGIRVLNLRIGVVLSRDGGALKAMLPAFRLGLGSRLGDGKQWMSWIALTDLIRIIEFCMENDDISGPVNCTAPNPVRNAEFSKTLATVLHRPTFLPVPRFLLKLAPGGMADEALLASERVVPEKLLAKGFDFQYPELRGALESLKL